MLSENVYSNIRLNTGDTEMKNVTFVLKKLIV